MFSRKVTVTLCFFDAVCNTAEGPPRGNLGPRRKKVLGLLGKISLATDGRLSAHYRL
jgi:hypothetical protein